MKNVIEASIYLIIMTLICYISLDFILMNQRVSKINEVTQYIEDYIEIHGSAKIIAAEDEGSVTYEIDETTLQQLQEHAKENSMEFSYDYENKTSDHVYFNIYLKYTLSTSIFKMQRPHVYHGYGRICI